MGESTKKALLLAVAVAAVFWAEWRVAAQEAEGVKFQDGIPAALRQGKVEKKVAAVFFYMPTCQWCRKMESGTFTDQRVMAVAARFAWAKVDVSARQDIAAFYGVPGVPYIVLFNMDGQAIDFRGGYTTPEQMAKYLGDWANKADAPGAGVAMPKAAETLKSKVEAASQPSDLTAALVEPVELLSKAVPSVRTVMLEQIKKSGPRLWGPLAAYLADERLSVRAVAGEALAFATGADVPFEPFADAKVRETQIQAWRTWIARNADIAASRPATATAPASGVARE